jgi:DNA-binding IclR family transcriptional regulator
VIEAAREEYSKTMSAEELSEMISVLKFISSNSGATCQDICAGLGLPYDKAISCAGLLEADGYITMNVLSECCINVKID